MKQSGKLVSLCETALFITLVFLGVYTFKIPLPMGYIHIGDSMIFLAVLMLGGRRGALAGGIGAALADIVAGYTVWALPTFFFKGAMALTMAYCISHGVFHLKGRALWIVSAVAGGLVQGIGYDLVWLFVFGKGAAIAAIGGLAFQAAAGIVIALVITELLQKTALRKKFIYTTTGKEN